MCAVSKSTKKTNKAAGSPKIFYLPTWDKKPSGGTKQQYRHVDILTRNSFEAYIVVPQKTMQANWFEYQCPVIDYNRFREIHNPSIDFVVLAEVCGREPPVPGRKIIFNQNIHLTFMYYGLSPCKTSPYNTPAVEGAIVVSKHNADYLQSIFPHLTIYRIRNGVDSEKFKPASCKSKRMAAFTKKNIQDVEQVLNALVQKGVLDHWQVRLLEDVSESEVAQILSESVIYLHFGSQEGLQLSTKEAMLSGCYVIGYHGFGGKEIMKPKFSSSIEAGDIAGFVNEVERVVGEYEKDPQKILSQGLMARDFIARSFSMKNEERELLQIWKRIISRS